jgi:excisionase family DNA binding protein
MRELASVRSRSDDRYLSLDEVANLAGVHKGTVYRWIANPSLSLRELVLRLPGGRIRIKESQFRGWLETLDRKAPRLEQESSGADTADPEQGMAD